MLSFCIKNPPGMKWYVARYKVKEPFMYGCECRHRAECTLY